MKRSALKHPLIYGTAVLTFSGLLCRVIGFIFRIFLSRALGAEGLGIYQLAFPILNLCFAFCCAGFNTSISRCVAAKKDPAVLTAGLTLSLGMALTAAAILYVYAAPICTIVIQEPRCIPLLQLLALSVPFSAVSSCLCGYFYGIGKPTFPAAAQILEQLVRVGATWFIYETRIREKQALTPQDAILSILISEGTSAVFLSLYCLFSRKQNREQSCASRHYIKPILHMALPLTANRLMLTGLSSIEAILIPLSLRRYGMSTSEALGIYGIVTGMVMPFLQFPSALTNSAAVMLLPEVAQAQAKKQHDRIRRTASVNLGFCCCLGAVCTLFFLTAGRFLGTFFYSNETAGSFLTILAWLCPFLYLSTTVGSILNGLGKTTAVFVHHICSAVIRLAFIWFLTPKIGIRAWLWGMLAADLLLTGLHMLCLRRELSRPGHTAVES